MTIGNEYILYDDRGLKVDFYLDLLDDFKNIGVMLSGGPDSAFVLYWLAKCIHENDLDNTILPMIGWELPANYQPFKQVKYILDFIKKEFPNSNILQEYTYCYPEKLVNNNKGLYEQHKVKFIESGLIDHYINGVVAAPLFEDIFLGAISVNRDKDRRGIALRNRRGPFQQVDKKFIAYQYKKYDLMDNLFPNTVSCVHPDKAGTPCRQCWWCMERWWAFGIYDDGRKDPPPELKTIDEWYREHDQEIRRI